MQESFTQFAGISLYSIFPSLLTMQPTVSLSLCNRQGNIPKTYLVSFQWLIVSRFSIKSTWTPGSLTWTQKDTSRTREWVFFHSTPSKEYAVPWYRNTNTKIQYEVVTFPIKKLTMVFPLDLTLDLVRSRDWRDLLLYDIKLSSSPIDLIWFKRCTQ